MKKLFAGATLMAAVLVANPIPAHAYLDGGTGSMLMQLLLGGTAGLATLAKLLWQRLFSDKKESDKEEGQ